MGTTSFLSAVNRTLYLSSSAELSLNHRSTSINATSSKSYSEYSSTINSIVGGSLLSSPWQQNSSISSADSVIASSSSAVTSNISPTPLLQLPSTMATNLNTNIMRDLASSVILNSRSTLSTISSSATVLNASLNDNGTTTKPSLGQVSYNSTEIMLLIAFFVILTFGTIGNGYVYYYFRMKRKSKRSIPELLFSYLAIFDFTSSMLNPIVYINFTLYRNQWNYGEVLCKSTLTIGACVTTISGGIFIIIAFDRERCIVFPFKSHYKEKTIKICVVIAIIYAFLMNFHYALSLKITARGHCTVGNVTYISYWLPTIICFVIQDLTLIFVFAFTNMRIFDRIKSKDTTLALGALWGKRKKDSAKVIRLLVVLATVFFVLTLPRDIFLTVHMLSWVIGKGINITAPIQSAYYFIKVLHTANSSVNVFIYYYMHRGFRRHVQHHVFCFIYGTPPPRTGHFLDNIATGDNSPNLIKRLQSPLRSPLRSNNGQSARNDVCVDIRMINEANIGRKRNARDRPRNNSNTRTMITNFRKEKEETTTSLLDVPDGNTWSTVASSTESESSFTM